MKARLYQALNYIRDRDELSSKPFENYENQISYLVSESDVRRRMERA